MIELFNTKKDCCGCASCANVCPKQAIKMEPDKDGFIYPIIDDGLCVDCGLCKKVCAFQNKPVTSEEPIATYAAINKNQTTLLNSSSGGLFGALAYITFEKNGVVFGCAWNANMEPEHICIDNPADMYKLHGSKYVQSDVKNTYVEAKKYLEQGRAVLYTGVPCHIAGFKSYLGRDYKNLITADLICHGVPNVAFFKGYITWLEQKLKSKIKEFKFRDKSNGRMDCVGKVTFQKDGKTKDKIIYWPVDYYYNYFMYGYIYRESCYECNYAGGNRQGDFTMGDYWGIEKAHPEIDANGGVSVLLVNSEKGMMLIEKLSEHLTLTFSTFEQARVENGQLRRPVIKSDKREAILKTWFYGGYQAVADEFYKQNKKQIIVFNMKKIIPRPFKKGIKKLLGRK